MAELLPEYLFERGIEYHARRKIRQWCDCSYCHAKRRGTVEIAYGTQRWSQGYLVPGYRVRNQNLIGPACTCTDGCPNRMCMADSDRHEGAFFFPHVQDFSWRRLPPNDNLDEAIRNRNERIREQLRIKLRYELKSLKSAHLPNPKLDVKIDFRRLGSCLVKEKDNGTYGNQHTDARGVGSNRSSDGGRGAEGSGDGRETGGGEAYIDGIHFRGLDLIG